MGIFQLFPGTPSAQRQSQLHDCSRPRANAFKTPESAAHFVVANLLSKPA